MNLRTQALILDPGVNSALITSYIDQEKYELLSYGTKHDPARIEILIIRSQVEVNEALLETYPQTTHVLRVGVGLDKVDKQACADYGVEIINTPGANAESVADL